MEVILKTITHDTACIAVFDDSGEHNFLTEMDFAYRDVPECRWEYEITEELGIPEVPNKVLRQMHKAKIKG